MRLKFILICLLFIIKVNGQNQPIELPKIIPPSPNAASLGEYGQVPVGLFTGTPQINIPIHTVKSKNISIPISLNYSSNGIRVDQLASNVGLGWSLNAGGVITRTLRDEADEYYRVNLPNEPISSQIMKTFLHGVVYSDDKDTQPDIFSFNFNGYSGKFYLDNSLMPILINPSPVKIERINSNYKITDPNGIVYWFGGQNATEVSFTRTYGVGDDNIPTADVQSAWYLTKVSLPNGDEINFVYENYNTINDIAISQTLSAYKERKDNVNGGLPYYLKAVHDLPIITKSYNLNAKLIEVNWKKGKILFNYSTRYSDVTNSLIKLDDIFIYDEFDNLLNSKKFHYLEENALSSFLNPDNQGIDQTNNKRLFLEKIDVFSKDLLDYKSYNFDYYSPNELPPRLSYAQDYWGYFNGSVNTDLITNDLSSYTPFSYEDPSLTMARIKRLFNDVGGNKKSNGMYAKKGLLKKISYPTGGFNEFFYEPHSYYGTELIYPNTTYTFIALNNGEDEFVSTETVTTNPITFEQPQTSLYLSTEKTCSQIGPPNATLTVKVAEQGSNVFVEDSSNGFYTVSVQGGTVQKGTSFSVYENSETEYFIDLHENKRYQFYMRVLRECVKGDFNISYYDEVPQEIQINIEVGGLRLQHIITDDNRGNTIEKKYHYGNLACIDCSSGELTKIRPAISFFGYQSVDASNTDAGIVYAEGTRVNLSSSTLSPLYDSQGYHINYKSVIEEIGQNFENGVIEHNFNVIFDGIPAVYGDEIIGTTQPNGFGNGDELKTVFYKKNSLGNLITQKKIINEYKEDDNRLNSEIEGFTTTIRNVLTTSSSFFSGGAFNNEHQADFSDFNLNKYKIKSHWRYIDKSITSQYDNNGLNPIVTTKNYFYNNSEHKQITKIETTTSQNNQTLVTEIDYAHDLLGQEPLMQNLINDNRIAEPIQTKSFVNNSSNVLSHQLTKYTLTNDNLLLPEIIQTAKGTQALEDRIVYHKYDDKGNPLEASKKNGQHIVYVWGHNQTQPIAKIINATYTEVETILGADFVINDYFTSLQETNLRNGLPNAQVTTIDYFPLIGISTITDQNGDKQTYHYDNFNRLKFVKDTQNNILSKNEYHFRSQN